MADRQTGSVWTHYDGSILNGPLAGQGIALEMRPIVHTTWSDWIATYPDTTVLDWYPEFEARYRTIEPGRGGLGRLVQRKITVHGGFPRLYAAAARQRADEFEPAW